MPDVLISGHHGEVRKWRRKAAIRRTIDRRPDLWDAATLSGEDRDLAGEAVEEEMMRERDPRSRNGE